MFIFVLCFRQLGNDGFQLEIEISLVTVTAAGNVLNNVRLIVHTFGKTKVDLYLRKPDLLEESDIVEG